jgi:hypothetical protein
MKTIIKKNQHGSFRFRAGLLITQILLPFGLYCALDWKRTFLAWLIGVLFTLSMVVLIWLG